MVKKSRAWASAATIGAACLVVAGFVLADLSGTSACSGPIYDTSLCESARLRQSLFASSLAASGVIALALIVAASIIRGPRPWADANAAALPEKADKAN